MSEKNLNKTGDNRSEKISDKISSNKAKITKRRVQTNNNDVALKNLAAVKGKRRTLNTSTISVDDELDNNITDNDNLEEEAKKNVVTRKEKTKDIMASPEVFIKTVAKKVTKATIKLAMTLLSPLIIGIVLAIFVIFLILGPIMNVWEALDKGTTNAANSVEKFTNFYRGFGFEDSKQAFFDEVNNLQELYDDQLNLPLLLSTLFYTEQEGYDTDYESIKVPDKDDPISSFSESDTSNVISYFKSFVKEKLNESGSTTDDNGLNYSAGKIYRLRRLAGAMSDRNGIPIEVDIDDFISKYSGQIGMAVKNVVTSLTGLSIDLILGVFELAISGFLDLVTLDFNGLVSDTGMFINNIKNSGQNVAHSVHTLLSLSTFGLAKITKVNVISGKVTYIPYTINIEKYDEYLRKYYIKNTPEFSQYLTGKDSEDGSRIQDIINNIHSNEKAFRELLLNEIEAPSEVYADGCIGAIDNNIINKLKIPTDIGNIIYFDNKSSYGIKDGLKHNGVDLNESNSGISFGNNVYAIADGKVEIVEENKSAFEGGGITIKLSHNMNINEKIYKFYSLYSNLDSNSINLKQGDTVTKGNVIGKIGKTTSGVSQLHFEFRNESDVPIDPTNLFIACTINNSDASGGNFSAHATTLTKEAFVNGWINYCNQNSCNSYFTSHIGEIYDYSIRYNINPEFVVTRAMSEGYSPGGDSYNFWGVGCGNTSDGSDCVNYDSLQSGIKGLSGLSIIEEATTVSDIMGSYAYIGTYWYNPGSWSQGGCAYFNYVSKYLSNSRTSIVGNACIPGKICNTDGSGQCIKTIKEDQDAYAKWQVDDKMNVYRKAIWKLEN